MDVEEITANMSLEEKAALCSGGSSFLTKGLGRHGVRELYLANGSYGVLVIDTDRDASLLGKIKKAASVAGKLLHLDDNPFLGKVRPSTHFPCSALLASTWDVDLARQMGEALGDECRAAEVDVLLGPGVNIKRSPLCGRNFEYYSEDPCLAGEIAVALVQGVQSCGVGVSLKHYALNSTEARRFSVDALVDERTMREIYLAPFERVVRGADPWTIMASYNKVNGEHACENPHLLREILREEWGYTGVVMSDWGAVRDRVKAHRAGLDLEMPGPQPDGDARLAEALRSAALDPETLDGAVRRILSLVGKADTAPRAPQKADHAGHHALAVRIAEAGMVLLKNEASLLPLNAASIFSLAVIGQAAKDPNVMTGGSAYLRAALATPSPLEAIEARLRKGTALRFAPGYSPEDAIDESLVRDAVEAAARSSCALIVTRQSLGAGCEGNDRMTLNLPEQHTALIRAVCARQPNTIVAVMCASSFETRQWDANARAILVVSHAGQAAGEALANIIFGAANPSGRLAETFPLRISDTPDFIDGPLETDELRYGEGIFVGYRYYDKRDMAVAFPFGHGLSYTTFEYSDLQPSSVSFSRGEPLGVACAVKNTGMRPGREVVQLYVRDVRSLLPRPEKELKAFASVSLEPGERKQVTFRLEPRDFAFYYPGKGWVQEKGSFEVLISASSRDIRLRTTVLLADGDDLTPRLTDDSTVGEWYHNPRGREALRKALGPMLFGVLLDPRGPFFRVATTAPLRVAVRSGYITHAQCDRILAACPEEREREREA